MKDHCLSCEGVTIASIQIPPFKLRHGDFICLHMPCLSDSQEAEEIAQTLSGQRLVPGLHVYCPVSRVYPAIVRASIFNLLYPRAATWLRKAAKVSPAVAEASVARLGIRKDCMLAQLSGVPKAMLGLEAAWLSGATVVLFTTIGIGGPGLDDLYAAVTARLGQSAAIHLSYAHWTNGQLERDCYPGATCLELTTTSRAPGSLTSS